MRINQHKTAVVAAALLTALLPRDSMAGPAPPPEIMAELEPHLAEAGYDPADAAAWPEGLLTPLDVSADGVTDWLVDFIVLGTPNWCGTGGCREQLWVSDGRAYRLALDEHVIEISVRAGTARTLDLELHGTWCNRPGNAPCSRSFEWDPSHRRLVETANASGETLLTGEPLFQPVAIDPGHWPEPLLRARNDAEDECVAAGGEYGEWMAPASSIPDIDGDGERDWVLDGTWMNCEGTGDQPGQPGAARIHEQSRLMAGAAGRAGHELGDRHRDAPGVAGPDFALRRAGSPLSCRTSSRCMHPRCRGCSRHSSRPRTPATAA